MKRIRTQSGGLDVQILEPVGEERPDVNVVLCHGYGAPADDLVGLAAELTHVNVGLGSRVRWIFPAAPLSLEELGAPMGRAWWHLDMERLIGQRDWTRYVEEVPEGLPKARRLLMALLEDLESKTKVPIARTILGGFSQGAMLTTDVALRLEEAPLGLCVLSGALLSRAAWEERAKKRTSLPVFQSHGRQDQILPFEVAERLRKLLETAGMKVTFVPFQGPHGIAPAALEGLAAWLVQRLPTPK